MNTTRTEVKTRIRKTFEQYFDELQAFIAKEKRLPLNVPDESSLYNWFCKVRNEKINVTEDQQKKMDNFIKSLETNETKHLNPFKTRVDDYNKKFNALKEWMATHNNVSPKPNSSDVKESTLGEWVSDRRKDRRSGKIKEGDKKFEALTNIPGFSWGQEKTTEKKEFNATYEEAEEWIRTYRKFFKRGGKLPNEHRLAQWYGGKLKPTTQQNLTSETKTMLGYLKQLAEELMEEDLKKAENIPQGISRDSRNKEEKTPLVHEIQFDIEKPKKKRSARKNKTNDDANVNKLDNKSCQNQNADKPKTHETAQDKQNNCKSENANKTMVKKEMVKKSANKNKSSNSDDSDDDDTPKPKKVLRCKNENTKEKELVREKELVKERDLVKERELVKEKEIAGKKEVNKKPIRKNKTSDSDDSDDETPRPKKIIRRKNENRIK